VHQQTFTDFIHIIINDAGEIEPVEKLLKKYSSIIAGRVRLINNPKSHGMEAATNKAISSVDSELIAIHDDDDTWHKDCLRLAVEKLENSESAGVVVRTDKVMERIINRGKNIEIIKHQPWMPDMKGVVNLYRQCIDNQMTPITFIYRRKALEKVGYYDESLPVLGDWDFGIRFIEKYDVDFIDPGYALAFYHHRPFTPNSDGNSNFGGGDEKHRYYSNKLMNKYLRRELAEGKLGVGYIMSSVRYEQSYHSKMLSKVAPRFISNAIKRRILK
jgi:glycosyltransferase involved in cell wall biosynthesis